MSLAVMALGTIGFMTTEKLSLTDAFYFSLVTVTTVGYGDIHPSTTAGKYLAVGLIVLGVGTFLGAVANLTELLLARREKRFRLQKLNMVVGVFFSELGTPFLAHLARCDPQLESVRQDLMVRASWGNRDFARVKSILKGYAFRTEPQETQLADLRSLLAKHGQFLLGLWDNPYLLEHESFTETLRTIFHLREELLLREDLGNLPRNDLAHIAGDISRVYGRLCVEWVNYMHHLKDTYPYLFSLAMRTNPFDRGASPVVK